MYHLAKGYGVRFADFVGSDGIARSPCPWAVPGPSEVDQRRQSALTGDHPHPLRAWAPRVDLRHWAGYAEARRTGSRPAVARFLRTTRIKERALPSFTSRMQLRHRSGCSGPSDGAQPTTLNADNHRQLSRRSQRWSIAEPQVRYLAHHFFDNCSHSAVPDSSIETPPTLIATGSPR